MFDKTDVDKTYKKFEIAIKKDEYMAFSAALLEIDTASKSKKSVPSQLIRNWFSYFQNPEKIYAPYIEAKAQALVSLYSENMKRQRKAYFFSYEYWEMREPILNPPPGFKSGGNKSTKPIREKVVKDWSVLIENAAKRYFTYTLAHPEILRDINLTVNFYYVALDLWLSSLKKEDYEQFPPYMKAVIAGRLSMWSTGLALNKKLIKVKSPSNENVYDAVKSKLKDVPKDTMEQVKYIWDIPSELRTKMQEWKSEKAKRISSD